jgi:parallel beta-helix repeat protein
MQTLHKSILSAFVACALVIGSGVAAAEDIQGVIVRTLVLSEASRLVGDVTCRVSATACISFGAPDIALNLNGFTITGQGDPATGCKGASVANETGISSNGQANVGVRGPGLVQRFQGSGILFAASVRGWVQGVTTTTNCFSGILINALSSGVSVEGNVSVRNGQTANPCGGICIVGSNNSARYNETSGNGYAAAAGPATNFGIGIVNGNNNLVEANTAVGNSNGIVVFPAATNSVVRQNVVVGNPPIQVANSVPASAGGVDIWDQSPPSNNNVFIGNMCVTGINASCPNVSQRAIPRKPAN